MKRKAQVKMFETIAILVVFFFLVAFGFIFYTRIREITSGAEFEEAEVLRAIQIAERTEFMPEITCSSDIVKEIQNCIDTYKLDYFKETLAANENKIYYYEIFGTSKITIDQIYPAGDSTVLYDNSKENAESLQTQIPVSIYDPIADKYSYGVLLVDVYS